MSMSCGATPKKTLFYKKIMINLSCKQKNILFYLTHNIFRDIKCCFC